MLLNERVLLPASQTYNGETHNPKTEPHYDGHADFWEHEYYRFFPALAFQTLIFSTF
jgi:hypothetical protein